MARLESIAAAGFYPTPPRVVEMIASMCKPSIGAVVLDPCCGEGDALAAVGRAWQALTLGNELSKDRAEKAMEQCDTVTHGPIEFLQVEEGQVSALYLNPPYGLGSDGTRLELQFLEMSTPWLMPGGWLFYIVPDYVLKETGDLQEHLAAWYDGLRVYKFPDPEYERFKQVWVVGCKRGEKEHYTYRVKRDFRAALESLRNRGDARQPWIALPAVDSVPTLSMRVPDAGETIELARTHGPMTTTLFDNLTNPRGSVGQFEPVNRPMAGHAAMLVIDGKVDGTKVEAEGEQLLLKGGNIKVIKTEETSESDGDKIRHKRIDKERIVSVIHALNLDTGALESYNSQAAAKFEEFLMLHQDKLIGAVSELYPPLFVPNRDMPDWFARLKRIHGPQPLPGSTTLNGLLPKQAECAVALAMLLERQKAGLLIGECGVGKAQPLDAGILTPTGWTTMGEIRVGDEVINPAGGTTSVIGVYPQGKKKIYRVTFKDGGSTECCKEHLWAVITQERRWRGQPSKVIELQEIIGKGPTYAADNRLRYAIPLTLPVEFQQQDLPLDPYLLGLLVGDGTISRGVPRLSSMDQEILGEAKRLLPEGVSLYKELGDNCDYRITTGKRGGGIARHNPVTDALRHLGLYGHRAEGKFVPKSYLYADINSRVALLQGLLDTDGNALGKTVVEFCTVSKRLARDVEELVRSLGGLVSCNSRYPRYEHNGEMRTGQLAYRLHISLPRGIRPFRLTRKLRNWKPRTNQRGLVRAITDVEYVGEKEAQCIRVAARSQLYVTDDYIVTHNTCISLALQGLMHKQGENFKVVVMAPGQTAAKWARESERVLQEFGLKSHIVGEKRGRGRGKPILDIIKAMEEPNPSLLVMSFETAKNGPPWEPAFDVRTRRMEWEETTIRALPYYPWEDEVKVKKEGLFTVACCPDCGVTLRDGDGAPWSCYKTDDRWKKRQQWCPECEAPLWQSLPFKYGGRQAAATFLNRKYAGKFSLIIDEAHNAKGRDTDIGQASMKLIAAATRVIGMTGTIYDGKASGVFAILYRMLPEFRQLYGFESVQKFVEHHGLQETITTKTTKASSRSTSSWGYGRENSRTREIPGVTPGIITWILRMAAFIRKEHVSAALPRYTEYRVPVTPSEAQAQTLSDLNMAHGTAAAKCRRGSMGLMSQWLGAACCNLDYGEDDVIEDEEDTFSIAGCTQANVVLPKDQAILDLVKREVAAGRGVGIYFAQVNRRPWMPRMQALLEKEGIYSEILMANTCKKTDREKWFHGLVERCKAKDQPVVLLANGNLVKEGLDLVECPTLIETGIDFRLINVLQRDQRAHRITQEKECRVYFFYYEGTFQEQALSLVASKARAAKKVDGKLIEGLSQMDASEDLMSALIKVASAEEKDFTVVDWGGFGVEEIAPKQAAVCSMGHLPKEICPICDPEGHAEFSARVPQVADLTGIGPSTSRDEGPSHCPRCNSTNMESLGNTKKRCKDCGMTAIFDAPDKKEPDFTGSYQMAFAF